MPIIKYFDIRLVCCYCCLEGICTEKQRGLFSGASWLGDERATHSVLLRLTLSGEELEVGETHCVLICFSYLKI